MGAKKRQLLNQSLSPSPSHIIPPTPTVPAPTTAAMEAYMADVSAKLDMLCGGLKKMEEIDSTVKSLDLTVKAMDNTVKALVVENTSLRADIAKKDEKIQQLTEQVNRLDQASRSSSLRILGLPVTTQTHPAELNAIIFDKILNPILEAAKQCGDLQPQANFPPHFLISNAFAIPAKKASMSCPVILKLNSEMVRSLVFKHKKNALETMLDTSTNRVRNKFSIFEDLAPATHAVFRSLTDDIRVKSVWSYSGQIRFKTHESETVHKLKSLTDTYDSTVKPSSTTTPSQTMNN